jgi:hypothetical protein
MARIDFGIAGPDPADTDALASALQRLSVTHAGTTGTSTAAESVPAAPWDRPTAYARHRILACDRAQQRLRSLYGAHDVDILLVVAADSTPAVLSADDAPALSDPTATDVTVYPTGASSAARGAPAGEVPDPDDDESRSGMAGTLADRLRRAVQDMAFESSAGTHETAAPALGRQDSVAASRVDSPPAVVEVRLHADSPRLAAATTAYTLGGVLRGAVTSWEADTRIGVLCSASLSGPAIDTRMDRSLLGAIELGYARDFLERFPHYDGQQDARTGFMQWLVLCGLLEEMDPMVVDYVPLSAMPDGPGRGFGFAYWYSWDSTSLFAYRRGLSEGHA